MEKQSSPMWYEFNLLNEIFSEKDKRKFKHMLSPKLKEMWEKIEIFEYNYNAIKGYLIENKLPPSIMVGELISMTEELIDDLTFIVRQRLEEDAVEKFEKSVLKLKSKFEKLKENIVSISISDETKIRQISIYIQLASSLVLKYLKSVFFDFKESLSLISDVWGPMEIKFAEIATKRIGIIPDEEEKKKRLLIHGRDSSNS